MDKIHLRDMAFRGHHGCLEFERRDGQMFYVDLALGLNLRKAGLSDDLNDSVNYALVFETVRKVVEEETHNLIERVAEHIAAQVMEAFPPVQQVDVEIKKPNAPIAGNFREVAVAISRMRSGK
ncbi:dihydroneopterin aldolase [Cerasicoccus maritimus]|uniref:dihydroneopterin aldolase n=1 Tax=Cerasicoccus maritimus TaxID=490089 RepID=UPI0028529462|nr:dihydroneopterin aldolase [Cerasicoccus maritimus]